MVFRRNFVVVLLAFCICSVMFVALPIRSRVSPVYDPWADVSGPIVGQPDGVINMRDIAYEVSLFNTNGNPINRTQLNGAIELEQLLERILNKNYSDWYNELVGYWKLDEGSGNITADSSGNGNAGALGGNTENPTWVDGKYGTALFFNGSNGVVMNESQSIILQGYYCNFTLEAWVYMTKRPYEYQSYWTDIISKWYTGSESDSGGYALRFEQSTITNDNLVLEIGGGMGLPQGIKLVQYNSIDDLTLNQWHHVVATYDSGTLTGTLYIDGISKASNTLTQRPYVPNAYSEPLSLGAENIQYPTIYIPPFVDCFTGSIDNAMIYNRTLSAAEVMLHYLIPPP
jgi:Concanavalin A-like lectin/glucanases superfamily